MTSNLIKKFKDVISGARLPVERHPFSSRFVASSNTESEFLTLPNVSCRQWLPKEKNPALYLPLYSRPVNTDGLSGGNAACVLEAAAASSDHPPNRAAQYGRTCGVPLPVLETRRLVISRCSTGSLFGVAACYRSPVTGPPERWATMVMWPQSAIKSNKTLHQVQCEMIEQWTLPDVWGEVETNSSKSFAKFLPEFRRSNDALAERCPWLILFVERC